MFYNKLIFDLDSPGACGVTVPDVADFPMRIGCEPRAHIGLPMVSEPAVTRHYVTRSQSVYCISNVVIHLLGSCTMKYNPPVNDAIASMPGFTFVHPMQPDSTTQGSLEVIYNLERMLSKLTGFNSVSLVPAAGAHAEFVSVKMIRKYHATNGNNHKDVILIPASAHGTNPASAAICGYKTVTVPINANGTIDVGALADLVNDNVACLMITNPNTCGIFEIDIVKVADMIHGVGALVYCDGANFNAIVGKVLPAKLGIDIMHLNLHKTFSTPHGGGGPGGGVICCTQSLDPYMPMPKIAKSHGGVFSMNFKDDDGFSVGQVKAFNGHFGVALRALSYILSLGDEISYVAECAVLNANYLLAKLADHYHAPFGRRCMHECLLTDKNLCGFTANDVAKCLVDYRVHPMTVYFPLVVSGAMLIEPTETETKATLDMLIEYMITIAKEAKTGNKQFFEGRPFSTPVGKADETLAARKPRLVYINKETLECN